ncbi:hypothetical protein GW17_00030268 [Ensete ventricosum]|nr:hypothetical protein GW17_00030268 [Ensete ventricosum]
MRPPTAASNRYLWRRMHTASPTLMSSSGASNPASSGCVSISLILGTEWSPCPSSSS